jgi:hypothetical protein
MSTISGFQKTSRDPLNCDATVLRQAMQIWRLAPKAGQEDGNHTARPIRLHLLRQEHSEATLGWHLDLQRMQKDSSWWCMDSLVSRARSFFVASSTGQSPRGETNSESCQNTRRSSDKINNSTSERNCGGLEYDMGIEFSNHDFYPTRVILSRTRRITVFHRFASTAPATFRRAQSIDITFLVQRNSYPDARFKCLPSSPSW